MSWLYSLLESGRDQLGSEGVLDMVDDTWRSMVILGFRVREG